MVKLIRFGLAAGVVPGRKPPTRLRVDDVVELGIDGLRIQRQVAQQG
jgi:hypothetical protein